MDQTGHSSAHHNLPRLPTVHSNNPRMAVSKCSVKQSDHNGQLNIVSNSELAGFEKDGGHLGTKTDEEQAGIVQDSCAMPAPDLPTPPTSGAVSDESPKTPKVLSPSTGSPSTGSRSPSISPPTPVRKDMKSTKLHDSGAKKSHADRNKATEGVGLSPLGGLPQRGHEASPGGIRRTKTKGQIKKQLQRKKGRKTEGTDSGSGASTPRSEAQESTSKPKGEQSAAEVKLAVPKAIVPSAIAEPEWLVGDLLMGKVSGHPYWPCMVSYDPFESIYTRTIKRSREYHVQFFGNEGERGWVNHRSLIPFEGREAFEKWAAEMRQKNKKNAKLYIVMPRRQKAWNIAMKEAARALPMSHQERKQTFTFQYVLPPQPAATAPGSSTAATPANGVQSTTKSPKRQAYNKRKMHSDAEGTPSTLAPPRKRQKRHSTSGSGESDPDLSPSHIHLPEGLANQSVTQYTVFCQKRRDIIRREHPGYTQQQIFQILAKQWSELDEEQRSKFIPMGSDVKNLSQIMSPVLSDTGGRVCRASKPSKKKLEADLTTEMFSKRKWTSPTQTVMASRCPGKTIQSSPSVSSNVVEIIDQVAAGAGTIKPVWDETLIPLDLEEPSENGSGEPKKRPYKKKTEAQLLDFAEEETESQSSGAKEELSDSKWKPPKLPGDNGENDYELEIFRLNTTCNVKKENICQICEQPGELIQCEGPCNGTYHLSCLGLTVTPVGAFRCDECGSGRHTCFVCKKTGNSTQRCSIPQCGRYYHEDCIQRFPLTRYEKSNLICPLHTCATCAAENPKGAKISKGRMYRCVRCPTAYHASDVCIAAGSIVLAGLHIVCSAHFQPIKNNAHHSHINVSWCFMCSKGGMLLCCESCPAAFHAECLKIQPPNDKWYCADCARGKRPLYGEIVWVKLGSYRWWPGEICQPKHVPLNIQEKPHQVGEFPMRFFGSHDYYWTHQARVFLFQEGDKGSKEKTTSSSLAQVFNKAVAEATMAYKIWRMAKEKKEEREQEKNDRKPAPYKHIKTNYPVGNVQIHKADPSQLPRCECRPDQENPCGSDAECLNRMMLYECHPSVCLAGERCQNQRFTKRQYPPALPRKTQGRGWGLFTEVDIRKGTFVTEYVGDLIDEEECKRRVKDAHDNDITNFYMLTLDKNRIIDAGPKGNYSRFMNHSCQPNCETQKWNVNGDVRVGLFASEDIPAGSELTFNYNLECLGNEKTVCNCGAPNCSGFLGVRPKAVVAAESEKRFRERKKKKKKNHMQKDHEDDCYRCGEGGELVMCDKRDCPKVYHLRCLKLSKLPYGKWICPWHHCDLCGKRSVKLCSFCPNSFCQYHLESNIFEIPQGKVVCAEHQELLKEVGESNLRSIPNDPTMSGPPSSGDVTSESSVPSDVECSTCPDDEVPAKTETSEDSNSQTEKHEPVVAAVMPTMTSVSRRSSRTGSGHSDSDISEGRLCIVEDPDADVAAPTAETLTTRSTGSRKRGRQKSAASPLTTSSNGDGPSHTQAKPSKSSPAQAAPTRRSRKRRASSVTTPAAEAAADDAPHKNKRQSHTSAGKTGDSPLFDDEEEDFGNLVIDLPTV